MLAELYFGPQQCYISSYTHTLDMGFDVSPSLLTLPILFAVGLRSRSFLRPFVVRLSSCLSFLQILFLITLFFLLIEAVVNLCFPYHRFFFNILTAVAVLLMLSFGLVMEFRQITGPEAGRDWAMFFTAIIALLH